MKRTIISLVLLILILSIIPSEAQKSVDSTPKAVPIALSDVEQKRIGTAYTAMDAASKAYRKSVDDAATAALECEKAIAVLATQQKARVVFEASQREWDAVLEIVKARHSCDDCDLTQDGKGLVKPGK